MVFFGFAMLSITISFMLERPGVPPEGKQANKELNAKATQGRRLVRDEPVKHFFISKNEISCRRHLHRCFTPICKDQTPVLTSASHKYRRLVHAKADQIKAANSGGKSKKGQAQPLSATNPRSELKRDSIDSHHVLTSHSSIS
jgi:hypothetical protein